VYDAGVVESAQVLQCCMTCCTVEHHPACKLTDCNLGV
jgi:hypothetical protein